MGGGRPPIGLERMLRMHIAQQCLGLSDEGIEDAIYDIQSVRNFVNSTLSLSVTVATRSPLALKIKALAGMLSGCTRWSG